VGQTPILREWWTRAHRAAVSASSPEGTRYVHDQGHAVTSADVGAFLAHIWREAPGRRVILWDGARFTAARLSKSSWPTERPNGSGWSACPRMPRHRILTRGFGRNGKGSSCVADAVSICTTSGMSSGMPSSASAGSRGSSKPVFRVPDGRDCCTGQ
jgi:hypothetical protein